MKKFSLAVASSVILLLIALPLAFTFPAGSQGTNVPNKQMNAAPTFVLNILGKKSDYSGDPSYESSDRRTMFVPENVIEFLGMNGFLDCKIWVSQGSEFAVGDPNMFDDGMCNLTIGPGKYEVFFVALGKPGNTALLEGWIYNVTANEYLLKIGQVEVKHNKRPDWQSGHDMFYVSQEEAAGILASLGVEWPWDTTEVWIFDFINWLAEQTGYQYAYLWKLVGGCKHIQVRFYKVG